MDREKIVKSIACCGLVCDLCHLAGECDGCRNTASKCGTHSEQWGGCLHRRCCAEKKLDGCWECMEFPCGREMFDTDRHDVKIAACVRCIREDGKDRFIACVVENENHGIRYGFRKDYDSLGSDEAVLKLLRTGRKS